MAKTMGVSPLTHTIFYGNAKDNKWIGAKEDVTNMAIKADDETVEAYQLRFSGVPYVLELRREDKTDKED